MICLLCYRFSAWPVLPILVATGIGEVRTVFLPEYFIHSGAACSQIFLRYKCVNQILNRFFRQKQLRISLQEDVCKRGLYPCENGL